MMKTEDQAIVELIFAHVLYSVFSFGVALLNFILTVVIFHFSNEFGAFLLVLTVYLGLFGALAWFLHPKGALNAWRILVLPVLLVVGYATIMVGVKFCNDFFPVFQTPYGWQDYQSYEGGIVLFIDLTQWGFLWGLVVLSVSTLLNRNTEKQKNKAKEKP